ncbi:MAG: PaaI family thioesterase [Deltaproteobacteria bacterium]|nr:PaaI family thioesterase [Deltaproteobacteria bacterium]
MVDYRLYLTKLQSGNDSDNPFLAFMGMSLEELEDGYARFTMPIREDFIQGDGVMQGGLIVAMADESMAHAAMTLLQPQEGIVTIELKNNFIAPALHGKLSAEATIFQKGRSIVVGDCVVTNGEGILIARSSATFLIRPINCREGA